MHTSFNIGEAFLYSWKRFKGNWRVLSGSVALAYAVDVLIQIFLKHTIQTPASNSFTTLVGIVLGLVVAYAAANIGILEGKGVKATWDDLFPKDISAYLKVFAVIILVCLMFCVIGGAFAVLFFTLTHPFVIPVSMIPAILLGIAGIVYLSVKTRFALYFVVDGHDVFESIKKSFTVVDGSFWLVLGLLIVTGLLNIVGTIAFLVGLLVTIPLSLIMMGYAYHKLVTHKASPR